MLDLAPVDDPTSIEEVARHVTARLCQDCELTALDLRVATIICYDLDTKWDGYPAAELSITQIAAILYSDTSEDVFPALDTSLNRLSHKGYIYYTAKYSLASEPHRTHLFLPLVWPHPNRQHSPLNEINLYPDRRTQPTPA
jgi:hypothetical protein